MNWFGNIFTSFSEMSVPIILKCSRNNLASGKSHILSEIVTPNLKAKNPKHFQNNTFWIQKAWLGITFPRSSTADSNSNSQEGSNNRLWFTPFLVRNLWVFRIFKISHNTSYKLIDNYNIIDETQVIMNNIICCYYDRWKTQRSRRGYIIFQGIIEN